MYNMSLVYLDQATKQSLLARYIRALLSLVLLLGQAQAGPDNQTHPTGISRVVRMKIFVNQQSSPYEDFVNQQSSPYEDFEQLLSFSLNTSMWDYSWAFLLS